MVRIKIEDGIVEGELTLNEYGGKIYSFKGIPYAAPPVGHLRFKAPQPAAPWEGVRSAKEFGPKCYQFYEDIQMSEGSEDCLYINVYSPDVKPQAPLPVMFLIHYGGFSFGSGNDDYFGPEFLLRHDVILVTFNYRLNALGFLCLDTEDVPGNAGMKDQVAALRWVNKNIRHFGGDAKNVTIFGASAGAASVSFHLVSPMTKGLFKRAIMQSGAITCWWAKAFEPYEAAISIAKKMGCNTEDEKELYDFFISQPVESLYQLLIPISKNRKSYEITFGVVSEKKFGNNERFFYGDVIEVISNGIHEGVEVITGNTQHEGLLAIGLSTLDQLIYDANTFIDFFTPNDIARNLPLNKQIEVGRQMKNFYFKHENISLKTIEKLVDYLSMDFFSFGTYIWLNFYANSKSNRIYSYSFTCKSERSFYARFLGVENLIEGAVCHVDDSAYLFPKKMVFKMVDKKSETFKLVNNVTTLWTNFAKFGNPTPDDSLGVRWLPYTPKEQQYLTIGNTLKFGSAHNKSEIEFWHSIYKKYLPHYIKDF